MNAPAIERSTTSQIEAFHRTFLKTPQTLSVNLNGSDSAQHLRDTRSTLKKMAKSLIEISEKEKRALTTEEKNAFDLCTYLIEDVQTAFDSKQDRAFATNGINEANGATSVTNSRSLESFTDQQTGKAIPVLSKEHRFADHVTKSGNDISSRDFFAGLAGHKVSSEVREQSIGLDTKGGFMVPEHIAAEVIDKLRSKNTLIQAGARTMPMTAQTVRVCRVDSDPVASWTGEGNLIPDTDMSIGALDFIAHKLTCMIKVSRELLQDAGNASVVIMNAIATAMAAELDSACLYGTGVGMPLGIANCSTINSYSMGVDGAVLNGYDNILYGTREIVNSNAPIPTTAIMSPRSLIGYSLLKDGAANPLERPELIKNMQFLDTSKVPVNQSQGTSGAVCSSIILGGFEQLVIGIRSVMEIQVLNERFADEGKVAYLATMRADSAIFQPKAFCKIVAIKP